MGAKSFSGGRFALEIDGLNAGILKLTPVLMSTSGTLQERQQVVMKLDMLHTNLKSAIMLSDLRSAERAAIDYIQALTGG